ncbi:MAG: hypothetical protein ACI8QD_002597 [Cyclobacteriaceae bacterium]|jgi:hypothetical protein
MSWLSRLQAKWKLTSITQVIIVLIVFACTGTTILFLKTPLLSLFTSDGEVALWVTVLYYILILPIYNVVLLIYGFLFGQFSFFWAFEKRMWNRMTGKTKDAE